MQPYLWYSEVRKNGRNGAEMSRPNCALCVLFSPTPVRPAGSEAAMGGLFYSKRAVITINFESFYSSAIPTLSSGVCPSSGSSGCASSPRCAPALPYFNSSHSAALLTSAAARQLREAAAAHPCACMRACARACECVYVCERVSVAKLSSAT